MACYEIGLAGKVGYENVRNETTGYKTQRLKKRECGEQKEAVLNSVISFFE